MRMHQVVTYLVFAGLLFCAGAFAADSVKARMSSLEPIIGAHPPNIASQAEFDSIKGRYEELKSELDQLVEESPKDEELLVTRGRLQSMGHNFDYPGAWQGSTDDFKAVLDKNPANIDALVWLGSLWVHSDPSLAAKAEALFRSAQCFKGKEPIERAQSGMFFALYYQGKMPEAYRQSGYLVSRWPQDEKYRTLNETTRDVLARSVAGAAPVVADLAMAACTVDTPKSDVGD